MANMGLERLILVDPAAELDGEARMFGVGAHYILDGASRVSSLREAIAPFERIVGTTSTRDRSLTSRLIDSRELPALLAEDGSPGGEAIPTALVFGSEVSGLRNEELALCSPIVQIPTSARQPTLNLAQAVLVLAYELYVASPERVVESGLSAAATSGEVDGLFDQVAPLLEEVGFARDDSFRGVVRDLRQLAARAQPTSREITILRGICRRAGHALAGRRTPTE